MPLPADGLFYNIAQYHSWQTQVLTTPALGFRILGLGLTTSLKTLVNIVLTVDPFSN